MSFDTLIFVRILFVCLLFWLSHGDKVRWALYAVSLQFLYTVRLVLTLRVCLLLLLSNWRKGRCDCACA